MDRRQPSNGSRDRSPEETFRNSGQSAGSRDEASAITDLRAGTVSSVQTLAGNQAIQRAYRNGSVAPARVGSRSDEPEEREASAVAESVATDLEDGSSNDRSSRVSRHPNSGQTIDRATKQRIESLDGGGRPLSSQVRSTFDSALGRDFSGVRIHAGPEADLAARSINARAFTAGSDVVFRQGSFDPGSTDGRRLLAHELTHVVQQDGSGRPMIQRQRAEPFQSSELKSFNEIYAKANRDTKSCITILNQAIREAYEGELSDVELGSTIQDSMAALREADLVGDPYVFQFEDSNGAITTGVSEPDHLAESVEAKVKEHSTEQGWYLFGLSLMDGYHSVLLGVKVTEDDRQIWWLDQIHSPKEMTGSLDDQIESWTTSWWKDVKEEKGKRYRTRTLLWPFVEAGLRGTMVGEGSHRSYIPPEGGGRIPEW